MARERKLPQAKSMQSTMVTARYQLGNLRKTIRPLIKQMDTIVETLNTLASSSDVDFDMDKNYRKIEKRYSRTLKMYHELRLAINALAGSMEE